MPISRTSSAGNVTLSKENVAYGGSFVRILWSVILILIIVSFGYYTYSSNIFSPRPDGDKWQAVFLANGQVYFGKLKGVSRSYVTLSEIYYLQVSQRLQQAPVEGTEQPQPNINLIKLGDELHGPEDAMYIERSKILFWENLKSDSRVAEAIAQSKQ